MKRDSFLFHLLRLLCLPNDMFILHVKTSLQLWDMPFSNHTLGSATFFTKIELNHTGWIVPIPIPVWSVNHTGPNQPSPLLVLKVCLELSLFVGLFIYFCSWVICRPWFVRLGGGFFNVSQKYIESSTIW